MPLAVELLVPELCLFFAEGHRQKVKTDKLWIVFVPGSVGKNGEWI